jgi:hypothetical protein
VKRAQRADVCANTQNVTNAQRQGFVFVRVHIHTKIYLRCEHFVKRDHSTLLHICAQNIVLPLFSKARTDEQIHREEISRRKIIKKT